MSTSLKSSYLNPLHFVEVEPENIPQYLTGYMDKYLLENRRTRYQHGRFFQPWMKVDAIDLQFVTSIGLPQIRVVDCKMRTYLTFNMTQKQRNKYNANEFIYESSTALTSLPVGNYWFLVKAGSKNLISEPIELSETIENTILLQYKHRQYQGGIIFETGFSPSIRIPAILRMEDTLSDDTIYDDQEVDTTLIDSKPYEVYKLTLGTPGRFVPDWYRKKINRIISLSDVQYDGKFFTKNDGAKWEIDSVADNGLLASASIELRESINRDSVVVDSEQNTDRKLIVQYLTNIKAVGNLYQEGASNIIPVYDFE